MTIVNWMELTRPGAGELVIENRMNKPWKDSWCINGSSRPIVLPRYFPAPPYPMLSLSPVWSPLLVLRRIYSVSRYTLRCE